MHAAVKHVNPVNSVSLGTTSVQVAEKPVGGGPIATVRTVTVHDRKIDAVECMPTYGLYAKINVNPQLAKVLSVNVEKVDR